MDLKRRLFQSMAAMVSLLILAASMLTMPVTAEEVYDVTYTFDGNEKTLAGFAEGTVSITPPASARKDGYYLLYFADDTAVLPSYDELASIPITGNTVTHNIKEATFLPPAATRLAVFESDQRFLDNAPTIDQAVATIDLPSEKRVNLGSAEMTFGAISDVHMNYEVHNRGAYQKWASALRFFSDKKTDCVIVAGDMTGDEFEEALTSQYETYQQIIEESGYPAENIYECIGNHGNTTTGRMQFVAYTRGVNEERPSSTSPWFSVLIKKKTDSAKDNLFIFMAQELNAPGDSAAYDNFSKEQIDWVEETLERYTHTDTNIFLVEHSPFLDYGPGDRHGGDYKGLVTFNEDFTQTMRLKALLESHPDVIMMSGHTHLSLYDGENYSDENNTSCRMIHLGSGCQPTSYGTGLTLVRSSDGRYPVTPDYGSEAYITTVYREYITYIGYNLSTGKIIPSACFILPTDTSPASDHVTDSTADVYNLLKGSGTEKDPYLIGSAADFKAFTDAFNTSAAKESEMFGNNQYFRQIADIDMRGIDGYNGTASSGAEPYYFAGIYDGNGYSITVDITAPDDRSVFPAVYGTVCNVDLKGRITGTGHVQPIHTLHGNLINCLFEAELNGTLSSSGICYDNYGTVYNVYTHGTLAGDAVYPVSAADSSFNYHNVFHYFTNEAGEPIDDTYGEQQNDLSVIGEAFANRDSIQYREAKAIIGSSEMADLIIDNDTPDFEHIHVPTTVSAVGATTAATTVTGAASVIPALSYDQWVMMLLGGMLLLLIIGLALWTRLSKKH